MKTKILIIVTAVFLAIMLALTLTSRSVHEAGLPHVTAGRLTEAAFSVEYIDENGKTMTSTRHAAAVTAQQLEQGVYIIYTAEKNGDERSFTRRAEIICGEESNGYFEVVGGVSSLEKIVTEWHGEICEGEVIVL